MGRLSRVAPLLQVPETKKADQQAGEPVLGPPCFASADNTAEVQLRSRFSTISPRPWKTTEAIRHARQRRTGKIKPSEASCISQYTNDFAVEASTYGHDLERRD